MKTDTMEMGTVKFFTTNDRGGFGFLTLDNEIDIYFQRNDGGTVVAEGEAAEVETWQSVREPHKGDLINFWRADGSEGRPKAAPWCFHEEWKLVCAELANRPTYRLMRQKGSVGRRSPAQAIWTGQSLSAVNRVYANGIPFTIKQTGDGYWEQCWFEVERSNDKWDRCECPPGVRQAL